MYRCSWPGATYENFLEDLREAEDLRQCRYGVFDAEYKLSDGQSRQKLVFFLWYNTLLRRFLIVHMSKKVSNV